MYTDPYYLIRLIPAEGSIQVVPPMQLKEDFFMFQKVFDFLVVTDAAEGTYNPTTAGNIALVVIIGLLFLVMLVVSGSGKKKIKAQQLAFSAVAITLAVVISMYPIASLPFGGSITIFSMFFICLIGYLYGPKIGILTGVAYGFLSLIIKPYVVNPVQLFLDYPIAFGFLGLAGVFYKSKYGIIKGYALGVLGRFLCHFITGIIFFSSYAPENMNTVIYSLGYNAAYIVPEAIATIIVLSIPAVQSGLREVKRMATENQN